MGADDIYVVTGAAGDMGRAAARRLAPRGTVLLLDVAEDRLQESAEILRAEGATVQAMVCDVAKTEQTTEAGERVAALGQFRALAHTAGLSPLMAEAERVLEVDLGGSVRIMDALFPLVGPGSCAVLVASIAGYGEANPEVDGLLDDPLSPTFLSDLAQALGRPIDSGTAYGLAKRGVIRLAERTATAWGAKGARTVSISPGLIDTGMGRLEFAQQPVMATMAEVTPIKRPGQDLPGRAEDIAAAIAFLTSDEAAFVSGCDLRVDGGLVGAGRHLLGPSG